VVKENGPPRRAVILSKFTIVSNFKEWTILEVGVGQSFPKAYSFSPGCTLFSAGEMAQLGEWSRFNNQGQTFPREDSFSLGFTLFSAGGMAQLGEWSRFINQGQTFPREESFSLGFTLFSVGGMAQLGEWSRLRNQDNYSSMLEKNSIDNSWLMFYFLRENDLPDLTYVSGRMA
jgi:hypothetical protein